MSEFEVVEYRCGQDLCLKQVRAGGCEWTFAAEPCCWMAPCLQAGKQKRNLEHALLRKDKASLAEAVALLGLHKKAQAICRDDAGD